MSLAKEMESQWEHDNWAAWEEHYELPKLECTADSSRIEVLPSRTGVPTVRAVSPNGRPVFLHSSVDPVTEAQRVAASFSAESGTVIVVYGFGLGYLVEALLQTTDEKVALFVLEPDRDLFCAAMKARDLRPVIHSDRIYILSSDAMGELYTKFFTFFDPACFQKIATTGLPGHETLYSEVFSKTSGVIRDILSSKAVNLATMIKIGPGMIANSIVNMVDYCTHPGIDSLFGRFRDKPAIIVSAGPSLNKNIELLHEAKGKAVILAVGTAAKALQKRGIVPDFVVSIDPGLPNYEHFKDLDTTEMCLVTEMQSHPQILREFKGPMFVAGQMPVCEWLKGFIEDKGGTESGGSVANNCFSLAYKMGANPIVLVGQDLAYSLDGHSHAIGTTYENTVIANIEKGGKFFAVKANDGGEVLTDRVFYQFLRFFTYWIEKKPDREYINATEGGAFIEGTKIMTLREVLDRFCTTLVDVQEIIRQEQGDFRAPDLGLLVEKLTVQKKKMEDAIAKTKKGLSRLKQLTVACEEKNGKKMKQHLAAIGKINKQFNDDPFISNLPEWFATQDIHAVMTRTHQMGLTEKDDFVAAIADYKITFELIRSGAERISELIDTCIQEAERRMQDGR